MCFIILYLIFTCSFWGVPTGPGDVRERVPGKSEELLGKATKGNMLPRFRGAHMTT